MHTRKWLPLLFMILLAGCGGGGQNVNLGGGDAAPGRAGDGTVNWVDDADHVVFRIDVVGGDEDFESKNDVPLCTIYGNNRIVWQGSSQPGSTVVLFSFLEPNTVRDYILTLFTEQGLNEYESLADTQPPGEVRPVYEQIEVNVNGNNYVTDAFANWPPDLFLEVLESCRNLSSQPVLFEPAGGWLSATYAEYDPEATVIQWNAAATGIDLVELAELGAELWLDNDVLPFLWNAMTNSPRNRIFQQGDTYFYVGFQVPNVHRDAPPAPTTEELPAARRLNNLDEE